MTPRSTTQQILADSITSRFESLPSLGSPSAASGARCRTESPAPANQRLVVDRKSAHGVECIAHRFPDGRMRVNRRGHVVERGLETERRGRLSDDLSRQWPDRMHAENFAVLRLGDHLDESAVLAKDRGLAVREKRKLTGLH